MKRSRGKQAVYLFAQGCRGNINPFPLNGGIGAAAAAGRDLGQAVGRALDRMDDADADGAIRLQSTELQLPLQSPPPVNECWKVMEQEKRSDRRHCFAELLAIAENNKPQTIPMPIRAFSRGDLCILGMAHEPFAEYHHFVKQVCPFKHNVVFAYTNGPECYVRTKRDYELGENGGNATSPCSAAFMFKSRLPLARQCKAKIRAGLTSRMRADFVE